jgi:hypothetical protein
MAKTLGKKFTGALAKPIKLPSIPIVYAVHPDTEEAKTFYASRSNETQRQRLTKLVLLANHYGAKCNNIGELSAPMFFALLYRLALDCVPGLQTTDSQSGAGRPNENEQNATVWFMMVDTLKKAGRAKTDIEASAIVAELFDPTLGTNAKRVARAKRAKVIANYVSSTRASLKRKAAGKIH